ncbi:AN1-type zinc finger protein 2B isoform X1 [Ammospiza nelsoni]|uniref:AN1-type zinc finger protein 2B isoform X1 n=1 Tax=Ammospiza nelsoni TaxID=2857394 RepID=UPI00286BF5D6|nr:AN1-type zinc finger protein 2B isoform X1 [Ammospiza nelsoni]
MKFTPGPVQYSSFLLPWHLLPSAPLTLLTPHLCSAGHRSMAPEDSEVTGIEPGASLRGGIRDFLPLKCDACEQIFCTDHIAYAQHDCTSAYKKDVQVPVCPLCNTPVPVRRGEMPDVVVGEHIDRDCKSDPAQRKRKIFTNKCLKPGCKQKEMMKVICDQCHKNYCLKHRHPLDHDCSGAGHPLSKAGHAAVTRAQASSSKIVTASSSGAARPADSSSSLACARGGRLAASQTHSTSPPAVMLQNGLSEEEALQRALEMSLVESARSSAQQPSSTQEEEDLALARALSASEAEYQQSQRQAHGSKPSNCSMS